MIIKALGPGCANCKTLEKRTLEALDSLKIEALVEKVTDFQKIASYGIMRTPGLVMNEKVLSFGNVPTVETIKELILKNQNRF
jgi:small redox-active disulfide protein 2